MLCPAKVLGTVATIIDRFAVVAARFTGAHLNLQRNPYRNNKCHEISTSA